MRKPVIFVSSTFLDLEHYRKSVWRLLSKYYVEIRGMEEFGSRKTPVLETCLSEVGDCDIYVGILGSRYGSIDRRTGKSLTQIEFEEAIRFGKDIKVYMTHDTVMFPPSVIDFDNYSKVVSFRKSVEKLVTPSYFKSEDDLIRRIEKDIERDYKIKPNPKGRPEVVDTMIETFKILDKDWMCFFGIKNDELVEVFCGEVEDDVLLVPDNIDKGLTYKVINQDGTYRYDFKYTDTYGNPCTIGGLGYMFNRDIYGACKIVSSLMEHNVSVAVIKIVLDEFYFTDYKMGIEWKSNFKKSIDKVIERIG